MFSNKIYVRVTNTVASHPSIQALKRKLAEDTAKQEPSMGFVIRKERHREAISTFQMLCRVIVPLASREKIP